MFFLLPLIWFATGNFNLKFAVCIRESSPTCGQYIAAILLSKNKRQLYITVGFTHAFLTLSETSEFLYKTIANSATLKVSTVFYRMIRLFILIDLNIQAFICHLKICLVKYFNRPNYCLSAIYLV